MSKGVPFFPFVSYGKLTKLMRGICCTYFNISCPRNFQGAQV